MRKNIAYYKKVFAEIEKTDIAPIYIFKGQERYIMEELTSRLIEKVVGEDMESFNLAVEYGGEVDMERFISTANSFPFLGEKRILVLKELHKLKGKWKQLVKYANDPVSSSVVVFLCNTHDDAGRRIKPPRDYASLESAVKKNGKAIQFEPLLMNDLQEYVRKKAEKTGLMIDRKTAEVLIGSVGEDLYNIQNELDKLSLFYEKKEVTSAELASVIGSYRLSTVNDLLDSTGLDDGNRPIELLSGILKSGAERPSVVVYLLIRHFLALLKVRAAPKRGGGYLAEKLIRKAERLGTKMIIIWLENLRVAEILMKSVSFPEILILESVFVHSSRGIRIEGINGISP